MRKGSKKDENLFQDPRVTSSQAPRYGKNIITVKVGPGPVEFGIFRDLICQSSPYFKRMMESDFEEASTRVVTMQDEDPDIFDIYVQWLFTRKIITLAEKEDGKDVPNSQEWWVLAKAIALADKLEDVSFQDTVVDALIAKMRVVVGEKIHYPPGAMAKFIFENTLAPSGARRLFIDIWVHNGQDQWTESKAADDFDKDFLFEVMKGLMMRSRKGTSLAPEESPNTCRYHDHVEGEENCYRNQHA